MTKFQIMNEQIQNDLNQLDTLLVKIKIRDLII